MRLLLIILLFPISSLCQSITAPPGRTYKVSTANQDASGFIVDGFGASDIILTSIGLISPPLGTTFSISTTTGLTRATGYNTWTNITRISFIGTMANVNNALASLKINTSATTGNVQISVSATLSPSGYYYNPTNGHFYRPISTSATYDNAKILASQQTFKGQTGYLVTITSSNEESFIIANVPQNNIWFALTDRAQEGYWRIDAGPENGTLIKTQNGQTAGNISGQYNNWCGGEPNNAGGEHFAVTKWGGGSCWNDLPGNWSNPYIVEFGTWTNPQDATFSGFYSANTTNVVAIANTLTGTISIPTNLTSRPILTLYRMIGDSSVLVDYKTVDINGNYTFTLPYQNTVYRLVPSIISQGITTNDFNLVFQEVQNINTPNETQSGLVVTGTKQWKTVDVNMNGVLDLGDVYRIAAHSLGTLLINKTHWFVPSDYDNINKNNFNTINGVSFFTLDVKTSDVTQNIKYCIVGDTDLSHSSQ